MALAEQPLKKRKLFENPKESPEPPPHPPPAPPPPPSQIPPKAISHSFAGLLPSQEDILIKRRNRDEIRKVYESYKIIRDCVSHKDTHLMLDLEHAYLSLITASRGCTSVQRIVADLIPKYAKYCPTALEAAAKVVINMHNWSLILITRGEDTDSVAFQTAMTCIFGLADICCTASAEAPTSSVIQGICGAVFLNVLTFFVSSFEGNNILQNVDMETITMHSSTNFSEMKQMISDADEHALVKLSKIRAISLIRIFLSCPKSSLDACFELLNVSSSESINRGHIFLSLLTSRIASIHCPSNEKPDVPEPFHGSTIMISKINEVSSTIKKTDGNLVTVEASPFLKNCLLGLILEKDSLLRHWVISKFKSFSKSTPLKIGSEITYVLDAIFESFAESVNLNDNSEKGPNDPFSTQSLEYRSSLVSADSEHHSNLGSERDSGGSKSIDTPKEFRTNRSQSPMTRASLDSRSDSFDISINHIQLENNHHVSIIDPSTPSMSASKFATARSQIVWYFDGDPSSMDICSASKRLWLGSLGRKASESIVRFQFERFGPIEHFSFFPSDGFALVGYRSIMDALKARECMRGQSPWGACLLVKFVGIKKATSDGSSSYVYIGNVQGPRSRDEIIHESIKILHKGPHMVTDLSNGSALLVKFENPEEAAAVMAHLRLLREASFPHHSPHTIGVANVRGSHMDCSVGGSRMGQIASSTVNFENHGLCVGRAHTFQSNPAAPSTGGLVVRGASEQMRMYTRPEMEYRYPTIRPSPHTIRPALLPNPSYPIIHHFPSNHNLRGNTFASPFVPASVTPLNPSNKFDRLFTRPLPPPLPQTQPPLVPPPPKSPQSLMGPPNSEIYDHDPRHRWVGALCKSGVHYCTVYAERVESDTCKYTNGLSEPAQWPVRLDMTKRTDFQHMKSTFTNAPKHKREACWLLPSSTEDHKGFGDFISYLNQRGCAGVIKMPAIASIWGRLLFILPQSHELCSMLSIPRNPSECLIAVVLPKETNE